MQAVKWCVPLVVLTDLRTPLHDGFWQDQDTWEPITPAPKPTQIPKVDSRCNKWELGLVEMYFIDIAQACNTFGPRVDLHWITQSFCIIYFPDHGKGTGWCISAGIFFPVVLSVTSLLLPFRKTCLWSILNWHFKYIFLVSGLQEKTEAIDWWLSRNTYFLLFCREDMGFSDNA